MPKVIKANLNDAANKILQGISIETTNINENTEETKKNTKAKKENTEKKRENSNATKQFNELLKQQQQALNSLNDSIQKQTKMINLQTDAMQKQVEVLKNLVEQKNKAIKVSEKAEGGISTGGRKGISTDGSKVYDETLNLDSKEITKSLITGTETVNTHIQNMIVKIREVNGEVKDVSVNFKKAEEEI